MNDVHFHHGQRVFVQFSPTDADGNPATVTEGTLVADNDAVTITDVSSNYGPNHWYANANHLGSAVVTASGKNSEGTIITDHFNAIITIGAANALGVTVSVPQ